MCLLGVTYLFEDNRRGWVKEGIAGVCGEGWEGRALPRCWEMWASNKEPAWAGCLAPLEGGVTR